MQCLKDKDSVFGLLDPAAIAFNLMPKNQLITILKQHDLWQGDKQPDEEDPFHFFKNLLDRMYKEMDRAYLSFDITAEQKIEMLTAPWQKNRQKRIKARKSTDEIPDQATVESSAQANPLSEHDSDLPDVEPPLPSATVKSEHSEFPDVEAPSPSAAIDELQGPAPAATPEPASDSPPAPAQASPAAAETSTLDKTVSEKPAAAVAQKPAESSTPSLSPEKAASEKPAAEKAEHEDEGSTSCDGKSVLSMAGRGTVLFDFEPQPGETQQLSVCAGKKTPTCA